MGVGAQEVNLRALSGCAGVHGASPLVLWQLRAVQGVVAHLAPAVVALLSCELQAAASAADPLQRVQPLMAPYLHGRPLLCSTAAMEPGV